MPPVTAEDAAALVEGAAAEPAEAPPEAPVQDGRLACEALVSFRIRGEPVEVGQVVRLPPGFAREMAAIHRVRVLDA